MYNEKMTSFNGHPLKVLTKNEYEKHKHLDRFIHEITFAHGVEGWDNYNLGMCYYVIGTEYYVSKEMQEIAKKEYQKRKNNIIKNLGNKLVFVGMGMDFKPSTPSHIGNHRIRTYFKNNHGVLCFIELGTGRDNKFLRCDHGLMHTKKSYDEWKSLGERDKVEKRQPIEKIRGDYIEFTKENVLKIVNENFQCSFKEMEVAKYFVSCDDFTCEVSE